LAGRYLVLMPNNPRGGGVSRRVEGEDRNELRDAIDQLKVPEGMSVIARTAAIGRSLEELEWDMGYLMQLWGAIEQAANDRTPGDDGRYKPKPFLIYLESSLVIRAIRDYFQPDIGEILIDTEEIYEQAQAFTAQNRDREAFSRLAGQVRLGADQQHRPLSRDRGFVLTQRPTRFHAEQHEIGR